MDVMFINIYVGKKVFPHKPVVALGVLGIEAEIFIHIKGYYMGKGQDPRFIESDKFLVDSEGAGPSGKPQDKGALFGWMKVVDPPGYIPGCPAADRFIVGLNNKTHTRLLRGSFSGFPLLL
jgi:hypothetical protein